MTLISSRSASRDLRHRHGTNGSAQRGRLAALAAALVLALSAHTTAAATWKAGYLLTNHETYSDSSERDYLRVLDTDGSLVEDVLVSDAPKWEAGDNIAWAAAAADGDSVFLASSKSLNIYSVAGAEPHNVSFVTMLPHEIRGVAVTNVDSLAVDANNRLYVGVSTGCLQNSPHECIGSYVVRYSFSGDDDVPRPTKVDAFPFVTHDLAMSQDGTILYGLDDPAVMGGARAIRQLNVTTMVPMPSFMVKKDSMCSALASGGPQGPIVACHGQAHPINTTAALPPTGGVARPVTSRKSSAVASATRLATNTEVDATYVWAYSPSSGSVGATLSKVNTSTGEAISHSITLHVPMDIRVLTVIPGKEDATQVFRRAKARRQLKGLNALAPRQRVQVHLLEGGDS